MLIFNFRNFKSLAPEIGTGDWALTLLAPTVTLIQNISTI